MRLFSCIRKQNTCEMKADYKAHRRKHVTWTRWATLPWMYGGVATIRNGAGDQGTHFPSVVTVAFPAAIVPALLVLVSAPIHWQAGACFNRRHKRSGCLCTKSKEHPDKRVLLRKKNTPTSCLDCIYFKSTYKTKSILILSLTLRNKVTTHMK